MLGQVSWSSNSLNLALINAPAVSNQSLEGNRSAGHNLDSFRIASFLPTTRIVYRNLDLDCSPFHTIR
jgi:hypothetical protein